MSPHSKETMAEVYFTRARLHITVGHYDTSIRDVTACLTISPHCRHALRIKFFALVLTQRFDEAIRAFHDLQEERLKKTLLKEVDARCEDYASVDYATLTGDQVDPARALDLTTRMIAAEKVDNP